MKRLRIYISGPMSGKENYLNDFLQATQTIRSAGHIPVNPAALETVYPDAEREEYLKLDLALLEKCDAVYFLPGWQESRGANREYGYALGLDKILITKPEEITDILYFEAEEGETTETEGEECENCKLKTS